MQISSLKVGFFFWQSGIHTMAPLPHYKVIRGKVIEEVQKVSKYTRFVTIFGCQG